MPMRCDRSSRSRLQPLLLAVGLAAALPAAGADIILYEYDSFGGRSFVAEVLANLNGTGFNDRASSLRIEGGYWLFCSDRNFHGDCLTFGPGDYPTLPRSLNNRISSGRRIHDQYPYSQSPTWPR